MNVCADMDGWMRTQWSLSVWWGRSSGGTLLPRWNADYKNKPQNKQKLCCLTCQDCSILFKFAMKSLSNFDVRLSLHPLQSHNNFCCFGVSVFLTAHSLSRTNLVRCSQLPYLWMSVVVGMDRWGWVDVAPHVGRGS